MARGLCIHHRDRPAAAHCTQCHKPVCTECTVTMPHGRFCSIECSVAWQNFRRSRALADKLRPSALMGIAIVFFVITLLAVGFHLVVSRINAPALQRWDLIGRVLQVYQERRWEKNP